VEIDLNGNKSSRRSRLENIRLKSFPIDSQKKLEEKKKFGEKKHGKKRDQQKPRTNSIQKKGQNEQGPEMKTTALRAREEGPEGEKPSSNWPCPSR